MTLTPAISIVLVGAGISGQVTLRTQLTPEPDPIVSIGAEGVQLGGDRARTLSWGAIKLVEGPSAGDARAYQKIADDLWRASARLARGDAPGALGPFERALAGLAGSRGVSRLHAAEGCAESRLRAGRHAEAIEPWLVTLQLQREGLSLDDASGVQAILHIDGETGLNAQLAPMWAPSALLTSIVDAPAFPSIDQPDVVVEALAGLYLRAASFEIGAPLDESSLQIDERIVDLPGIALVRHVVLARTGDAAERAAARDALRTAIEGDPSSDPTNWQDAWRRLALARSLLFEADPSARDDALRQLAHLPARFAQTQPALAGLALAEMAVEMNRRGSDAEADRLVRELESSYPWHPARTWVVSEMQSAARTSAQSPRIEETARR